MYIWYASITEKQNIIIYTDNDYMIHSFSVQFNLQSVTNLIYENELYFSDIHWRMNMRFITSFALQSIMFILQWTSETSDQFIS